MKTVTFIFESIRDLKNFEQQVTTSNFEIDRKNMMMTVPWNEKEIMLAETAFHARILNKEKSSNE
jgi:hypothetical protein